MCINSLCCTNDVIYQGSTDTESRKSADVKEKDVQCAVPHCSKRIGFFANTFFRLNQCGHFLCHRHLNDLVIKTDLRKKEICSIGSLLRPFQIMCARKASYEDGQKNCPDCDTSILGSSITKIQRKRLAAIKALFTCSETKRISKSGSSVHTEFHETRDHYTFRGGSAAVLLVFATVMALAILDSNDII